MYIPESEDEEQQSKGSCSVAKHFGCNNMRIAAIYRHFSEKIRRRHRCLNGRREEKKNQWMVGFLIRGGAVWLAAVLSGAIVLTQLKRLAHALARSLPVTSLMSQTRRLWTRQVVVAALAEPAVQWAFFVSIQRENRLDCLELKGFVWVELCVCVHPNTAITWKI